MYIAPHSYSTAVHQPINMGTFWIRQIVMIPVFSFRPIIQMSYVLAYVLLKYYKNKIQL